MFNCNFPVLLKSSTYGLSAVILATIIVLTSTLGPLLSASVRADIVGEGQSMRVQKERPGNVDDLAGPSIANYTRVILITGDIVHLYMLTDGTSRVAVEPADPRRVNRSFRVLEDGDGLYVIPSDAPLDKLDLELFNVRLLARQMQITGLNETLRVIVKPVREISLQQLTNTVSAIANEVKAEHHAKITHRGLNLASLTIDIRQPEKVKTLLDRITSIVERVWLDRVYKINLLQLRPMLDVSVPKVGADWVWANSQMSGENVKIAVLDTGIDFTHRDFKYLNGTSKVIVAESFVEYPPEDIDNPEDYYGHGTHVSGIAAGTGLTEFVDPNTLSPIAHPLIRRQGNDEAGHIAGNGTHLVVVWHSDVSGNGDVWYTVYDGGKWSLPSQLTTDPNQDIWPHAALLSNNRILVAWVSNRTDGRWEIWYKIYSNGVWSEDKQLTTLTFDHSFLPAFTELQDGTIGIIFSSMPVGSNASNIYFARLTLTADNTLTWIPGSDRQLTNATENTWLMARSLTKTSSGRLYAFWDDISNYNFETHWGGETTMYYSISDDGGDTWSVYTLASCSGCIQPYGIELNNGTLIVFFSGDDFEHNVPDTIYFMKLVGGSWDGPYWLPSDVWHRWRPSAAYGLGGLYVAFTSPGRPWEYYENDIYITTPKPRYMGVAPKADLMEGKVLNRWGWGYDSWIISGIEWAVENDADIISMSLGGWPTDGNDPLSLTVDWAFDRGVLVVVAAGNFGSYFGIASPGASRKALTVGAIDGRLDRIAWFSSRGPTLDYRVKPEIVAPGKAICSSVPEYLFHVPYECWDGTSMATPHVAGAAALLKQFAKVYFNYDAPPEALKNVLMVEATDDLGYNIYEQGAGRLDIAKAFVQSSILGYGGLIVTPEVINFGPVAKGTEVSGEILIKELRRSRELNVFELEVMDVFTGEPRDIAQLNTTTIEIGPGEQKAVKLTISPTAPTGLYSGKIMIIDNYNQTYNVIFGIAVLNRLDIHKIPWEGPGQEWAVAGDIAYVFILDPDSDMVYRAGRRWNWFDMNGNTYLFLPDGTYEITTAGEYSDKSVILARDNLTLTTNFSIVIDERNSYEVVFNPAKTGQIFAEVFHGMISKPLCPPALAFCYRHGFIGIEYYPAQTSVYYSYSATMWSIDRYVYYPVSDVNPSDPRIISTNIWHDLLYVEKEISSSKTRVANYSQLVTKHTEYRVSSAPRQSAERIIWAFRYPVGLISTISWLMNVPYSRTEIISPDTSFDGFHKKVADLPSFSTPYWEYFGRFWTGGMSGLETREVWGEQPLFPTVRYVVSEPAGDIYDIYLGAETFTDSYYYEWFHSRYPLDAIDVKIFKDGGEIPINRLYVYTRGDYHLGVLFQRPPARYTLKTTAYEFQSFSTKTILEYDFTLNDDGSISKAPVITNIDVKGLTLNNTLEKPKVDITFQLVNWTGVQDVTFEYSVDGGATWLEATVNVAGPGTYTTSFTVYGGQKYVSIRINATDTNNLKTSITTVDGFLVKGALTLADFPEPFISNRVLKPVLITPGASDRRGPVDPAHTVDVAASNYVATLLGRLSSTGWPTVLMDWEAATFDLQRVYGVWRGGDVITFGSPGVNLISYLLHHHPDNNWSPVIPAYFGVDEHGQYIYSSRTNTKYRMVGDYGRGVEVIDYALIALYYDPQGDRYILMLAGLSGVTTREVSKWLSTQPSMHGVAIILRFIDREGDFQPDVAEIVDVIG